MTSTPTRTGFFKKYRSVALPAEHGGWGFLLEPILLGLWLAPSVSGVLIALAATAGFLIHQPLKIAYKDHRRGRRYTRTRHAERFTIGYGLIAGLSLLGATVTAKGDFWPVLFLMLPLVVVQLTYDALNDSRAFIPEAAGAIALNGIAALIVLVNGGEIGFALLLWAALVLRTIPAIAYVRARLQWIKRQSAPRRRVLILHLLAVSISPLIGWGAIVAYVILLARAAHGLYVESAVPAKVIGICELIFGLVTVVLLAIGV